MIRSLSMALTLAALCVPSVWAAEVDTAGQEQNIRAYIELIRSDVKAEKTAIITKVMDLDAAEAAKFWPIYTDYEQELSKLGDERVALIRDYVDNYDNLSEDKAHSIALAAFDLEARRTELKKKYYTRFEQALSAKTAARFFQVENQILMLIDLQVASSLPVVH